MATQIEHRRDVAEDMDEDTRGKLRQNSMIVKELSRVIRHGGFSLKTIPEMIKKIIKEGIWRIRIDTLEIIEFDTFDEFIAAPLPEGLGTTIDQIKALCSSDREVMQLIHAELGEHYSPARFAYNQIKSTLSPDEIRELTTLLNAERNSK